MTIHPIIDLYKQQYYGLIEHLYAYLRQKPDGELERVSRLFVHSSNQMLDYIEKLHSVTATTALLNSAQQVDDILQYLLDTAIEITGAERAYIMLRDQTDSKLYIMAARAWDQEELDEADIEFSSSIVDHVLRNRTPVIALNAQTDRRFGHISSVQSKALRSLLCVPLIRRDQVTGVLYADNRVSKGVFKDTVIPLLEILAHHASLALENARRFQQTASDLDASRQQVHYLQTQIANQSLTHPLSERELEVMSLIASGLANTEIASRLGIGVSTVKKHINHIFSKLHVENRGRAIVQAQKLGLV